MAGIGSASCEGVVMSLFARRLLHGEEGGNDFDAIPEVLEADVFVGDVLKGI